MLNRTELQIAQFRISKLLPLYAHILSHRCKVEQVRTETAMQLINTTRLQEVPLRHNRVKNYRIVNGLNLEMNALHYSQHTQEKVVNLGR